MNPDIADLFSATRMSVSRTKLMYDQTLRRADAAGDPRLRALAEAGLAAVEETRRLDIQRKMQRQGRAEDATDAFDTDMDDAVRPLVRSIIDTHEYMVRTDHPARARVARLVALHFPVGPSDIIQQRYEEEYDRVRALIDDLRGAYADLLGELEVERKLERVEALLEPYAQALEARRRVTGVEVREAARLMHAHMVVMVAHVVSKYATQRELLDELLLPFRDQQARVRAIRRARATGRGASGAEGGDEGEGSDDELDTFDDFEFDPDADPDATLDVDDEGDEDAGADAGAEAAAAGGFVIEVEGPNAGRARRGGYWYDDEGQAFDADGKRVRFDARGNPVRIDARVPIVALPVSGGDAGPGAPG